MILDLHRQGLSVIAIARRVGRDPKTVRRYVERGLELPAYRPRQVGRPNKLAPFLDYLRERLGGLPGSHRDPIDPRSSASAATPAPTPP